MVELSRALFGAGCFWGVQSSFDEVEGVARTNVGYSDGHTRDPTYEEVCTGQTGHAEAIMIEYDPAVVSYRDLLVHLFRIHDPTTPDRQGVDLGSQYRSSIMYFDERQRKEAVEVISELAGSGNFSEPIVTKIVPAGDFHPAEEYHQKYNEKHGIAGCHF